MGYGPNVAKRSNRCRAVTYERNGVVKRRATFVASATGYGLVDENEGLLSEAEYGPDGNVRLFDGDRRLIIQVNKNELSALAER
jgi:hypothetical protein